MLVAGIFSGAVLHVNEEFY